MVTFLKNMRRKREVPLCYRIVITSSYDLISTNGDKYER